MQPTSSETSSERSPPSRRVAALALWSLVAAALAALALSAAREPLGESPFYDPALALAGLIGGSVLAGLAVVVALLLPDARAALGFRTFQSRWLWWGAGVIAATLVVGVVLEPILHGAEKQGLSPGEWRPDEATVFVLNALVAVLVVPFAEELFFRGVGVRVTRFLGPGIAIVLTGIMFSLAHGILEAVPPLAVFGFGLAWIRLRADSVWPCMVTHSVYNGIALGASFVA